MNWKPFQVLHGREDAIEAARWLRDRLAGVPDEPGKPVIPEVTRERVLRPQLERVIANWKITETELDGGEEWRERQFGKECRQC